MKKLVPLLITLLFNPFLIAENDPLEEINRTTLEINKKLDKVIATPVAKFYQKITDIYATALDYDVTARATKRFFATVQNKLHRAIHGQTAAEVVYTRADSEKTTMGLTRIMQLKFSE